jgi:hypothetical protein
MVIVCLALSAEARAETLVPGTGSLSYEFGSYPIPGIGTAQLPTFFKGNVVDHMLFSPQRGFPTFNNPAITPLPPPYAMGRGVAIGAGGATVVAGADRATGNAAQTVIAAFNSGGPGGGFGWLPGTSVVAASAFPVASVNASEAVGVFQNRGRPNQTLTGIGFGIAGFLPNGSYGSVAMTGTITNLQNNSTISFLGNPAVVAMNVPPFPRLQGADYAQGSSALGPNSIVQFGPVNNPNFLISPLAGMLEVPDPSGLGIDFFAYAISLGPTIGWATGSRYRADLTLTIIADPLATIDFVNPLRLDPNIVLPQFGGTAGVVPAPSNLCLLGIGCCTLAVVGYVRRSGLNSALALCPCKVGV